VVLVSRPSWSADGRLLAFALFVDRGNSFDESDVVITRTGQKRADLSCMPPAPPFEPEWSYEGLDRPALSPDGASLAVDGMAVCSVDGSGGYWLRAGDDPDWRR
jgi:WD40-like Beta Propeller Repeat